MPDYSPTTHRVAMAVQAVAAGSDDDQEVARAPFAGRVVSVNYAPDTAITGVDTNTRTFSLRNRGLTGVGTTVVATRTANLAGGNWAAFDEKALTMQATPNDIIAEGDVLEFLSLHVGTGIADPGGLVVVELQRAYA